MIWARSVQLVRRVLKAIKESMAPAVHGVIPGSPDYQEPRAPKATRAQQELRVSAEKPVQQALADRLVQRAQMGLLVQRERAAKPELDCRDQRVIPAHKAPQALTERAELEASRAKRKISAIFCAAWTISNSKIRI